MKTDRLRIFSPFSQELKFWSVCLLNFSHVSKPSVRVTITQLDHNATYISLFPSFPLSKQSESGTTCRPQREPWGIYGVEDNSGERDMCHLPPPFLPPPAPPCSLPNSWVNLSDPFPIAKKTWAMPNNCAPRSHWNARHASGVQWHTASLWHGQIRARHC